MDKISVIVPYYNNKTTIERCIESILDQTYPHFELIAVSDGSTDGTEDIIRRYALMDTRVVPVFAAHGGVSHARNVGLTRAEGAYIQFVDADDYVQPDMLEKMLGALKEHTADFCSCAFTHPFLATHAGDRVFDFTKHDQLLTYYQHTFAGHVPWNKLYRREVVTAPFIEGMHFCEDGMFGIANMFNAKKAVCISNKLYHYCVAPSDAPSLIGGMATAPFWETKETFWYQRRDIAPIAEKIFRQHLPVDKVADFAAVRLFDFLIWETIIYCAVNAPQAGIVTEVERVLNEPAFLDVIQCKENYGVRLCTLSDAKRAYRAARFVEMFDAFWQQHTEEDGLRPFYVCLSLFAALFLTESGDLNTVDLAAEALAGETPEAQYVAARLAARIDIAV